MVVVVGVRYDKRYLVVVSYDDCRLSGILRSLWRATSTGDVPVFFVSPGAPKYLLEIPPET